LREAAVERASAVFTTTPNDVVNINAASHVHRVVAETSPEARPEVFAHVIDFDFKVNVRHHIEGVECFNSYDIVSEEIFEDRDLGHLPRAPQRDSVFVIAGFGRFGSALLRVLSKEYEGMEHVSFWIVDPRGEEAWGDMARRSELLEGVECRACDMLDGDLLADLDVLRADRDRDIHFLICTDDDVRNLDFALRLADARGDDDVHLNLVTRVFRPPDFIEHRELADVRFFRFGDQLAASLTDQLGWIPGVQRSRMAQLRRDVAVGLSVMSDRTRTFLRGGRKP